MSSSANKYNFVFCGSSQWSAAILKSLIDNNLVPAAVITKIDKPSGRGLKIVSSELKVFALENNLKNFEVKNKLEFQTLIEQLKPDFAVVVDFGIIITKAALDIPAYGFLNIHPSLLPKYRGTSPIQSAILNNDSLTGISIMKLDEDIDHGPIYSQTLVKIEPTDTYGSLLDKLAPIASQALLEAINGLENTKLTNQNHDLATYTKKISAGDCQLDLDLPAEHLWRLIKSANPRPIAWLIHNNKRLKIISAHVSEAEQQKQFNLKCGDEKYLVIDQLQPEGKKIMSGKDYLNGLK